MAERTSTMHGHLTQFFLSHIKTLCKVNRGYRQAEKFDVCYVFLRKNPKHVLCLYEYNMPETKILSIPVPPAMEAFIHERIATQGFHTVSEYVRALIRADQQRAAREQ